ncbi:MAG: hypothetical protein ISS69_03025 [Phycisphaerae bacterium]|nr:hypothetical protein [Phycisphaerae bacterium]
MMGKHQTRSSGRTFVSVLLVAVAVSLAVAVWYLPDAASANRENPVMRDYLRWMAVFALAILLLTLVLLAMRGGRWFVARCKPSEPSKPTSQVSAWVEAGKRFKLPDDEQPEDGESPSET